MNQIKKILWNEHLKNPKIPFVGVTVSPNPGIRDAHRTAYLLKIACCPYCGEQHQHGDTVPIGTKLIRGYNFGHRSSHCSDRWDGTRLTKKPENHGYYLVYTGDERKK